ncbi:MAG: ABC transporter transmembrane domain-containing protein, partial [Verrucomicrobiota bacterium]
MDINRSSLKRMLGELSPYRFELITGAVCLFISAPGRLFHPLVWMFVIDRVIGQEQTDLLVPALVTMIIVQALSLALNAAQGRLFEQAGQKFIRDLRNRVFRKLNRQSSGYLHNQRLGDLTSRAISDIQTVQGSLIGGITSLCDELVTFVFVIAIIVKINWMIGDFVHLPLALTYVVMRHYKHRLKGYYQQASRGLAR